jgi:NDP-sugar pyrophosphorylase family protein
MYPLTEALPKPMAPFRGSTLIAEGIKKLAPKVRNIHVTIGYKKAMMAGHVIEYGAASILNTEGHSNSWWVYHTLLRYVDEPVVVLTCDNITDIEFDELYQEYQALGSPTCMLVPVKPVPGLEGDFIHHLDQTVHEIHRTKPAEIYCSGIQVLNPMRVASTIPEGNDFYDLWNGLIARRELTVSRKLPKKWFTVDTLDQLLIASRDLETSAGSG